MSESDDDLLASVVISTYNRADALPATLEALARQDIPPSAYEVLVVDDGSVDRTSDVLASLSTPYSLKLFRQNANSGVSAGRNVGMRAATGRFIIMISDDLIVPSDFIRVHTETLEHYPDSWVVGGFRQSDDLVQTPFGRYLDELEEGFEQARTRGPLEGSISELALPTARNLSMPRSDLLRVGFFDEQFRVTCEDQDLAERAKLVGIRFLYHAGLECIHNDQAADLERYCRFQQRGARDTVRFCRKYPTIHGNAPVARGNGYMHRSDGLRLLAVKSVKRVLALPPVTRALELAVASAERRRVPERALRRGYRTLIGVYTFRGFREGLAEEAR